MDAPTASRSSSSNEALLTDPTYLKERILRWPGSLMVMGVLSLTTFEGLRRLHDNDRCDDSMGVLSSLFVILFTSPFV
jgi:hypothetical protein